MKKEWNFKGSNTRRGSRGGDAMGSNNPGHTIIAPCPNCGETNEIKDEITLCWKCKQTYTKDGK